MSPASTSTTSPTFRLVPANELEVRRRWPSDSSLACVSVRVLAESIGLGFAAAFRDGFGKVCKQQGDPQPQHDLERERQVGAARH